MVHLKMSRMFGLFTVLVFTIFLIDVMLDQVFNIHLR